MLCQKCPMAAVPSTTRISCFSAMGLPSLHSPTGLPAWVGANGRLRASGSSQGLGRHGRRQSETFTGVGSTGGMPPGHPSFPRPDFLPSAPKLAELMTPKSSNHCGRIRIFPPKSRKFSSFSCRRTPQASSRAFKWVPRPPFFPRMSRKLTYYHLLHLLFLAHLRSTSPFLEVLRKYTIIASLISISSNINYGQYTFSSPFSKLHPTKM